MILDYLQVDKNMIEYSIIVYNFLWPGGIMTIA